MRKPVSLQAVALLGAAAFSVLLAGSSSASMPAAGRTDRLKGAPFYKLYNKKAAVANAASGHFAVGIDQTSAAEFSFAGREQALQPLVVAMNAYLDSLGWSKPLAGEALPEQGAPYVYVGSAEGEAAPPAAARQRQEHDKYPPMVIDIQNPSAAWRAQLPAVAGGQQVDYVLWLKLGFSEYPKSDKGMFGKKVVLGTGYEESVKFLSAEDKPLEVLQVTGIVLDREGRVVAAGAEGIIAKDTPFWAQVLEVKEGSSNAALQQLVHAERRTDLAGQPLKWQAALHNLMAHLLAQPSRLMK